MLHFGAVIVVLLLLGSTSSFAAPVTLTVDSSASAIASAGLIDIPIRQLVGTVKGDYNAGTQELTFGGGSDVTTATNLNLSGGGTIANQTFSQFAPFSLSLSGIAFSFAVSAPHLDLVSGTIVDGSGAVVPTWTGTGSGKATGSINVAISLSGSEIFSGKASFSALLTPDSPFNTSNIFGNVGLSDTGSNLVVTLPFALPLALSDVDLNLDLEGLPFILGGVIDGIISFIEDFVSDTLPAIPVPGIVVASLEPLQEAPVPVPPTIVLLGLGVVAAGMTRCRLRRKRAA